MATPGPSKVMLSERERAELERFVRAYTTGQQLALRARMVLAACHLTVMRKQSFRSHTAHVLVTAGAGGSITSTAVVYGDGSGEACDTMGGRVLYIGLNRWIPAETGAARCL